LSYRVEIKKSVGKALEPFPLMIGNVFLRHWLALKKIRALPDAKS
jgi:hypothetical protein